MSEVYWLGGAEQAGWEKEYSRLRIRPAWIDEAHWFGMPEQSLGSDPTSFSWPALPGLQARLLQDCARMIQAAERSLVLLASPMGVALLASPRAIGRLNLMPDVRLNAWGSLPVGSTWEALAQATGEPLTRPPVNGTWQAVFPPPLPAPQENLAAAAQTIDLPPALLERCHTLRQEMNDPAELLWQLLDQRQINQAEFSRRQELDGQVLDFFCPQAGLVVLIDHRADIEDAYRMHVFAQHGLRVLRFWNSQVIEDTAEVLQTIWAAVSGGGSTAETPAKASPPSDVQTQAMTYESSPSAGGIAGLNALCRALKPGWRGLLVDTSPGGPVMYIAVEGL
ncbi:MAG TPA: DUF559 domain-containing protein [Anaerolineaceae bacterium]|nr:DUF559 domain-containing protein [Anaerolineaceae bacterium]